MSSRGAFRVLAREKECSREACFDFRVLSHFQTSHSVSYSVRNSRLSDACRAMQPNELIPSVV